MKQTTKIETLKESNPDEMKRRKRSEFRTGQADVDAEGSALVGGGDGAGDGPGEVGEVAPPVAERDAHPGDRLVAVALRELLLNPRHVQHLSRTRGSRRRGRRGETLEMDL